MPASSPSAMRSPWYRGAGLSERTSNFAAATALATAAGSPPARVIAALSACCCARTVTAWRSLSSSPLFATTVSASGAPSSSASKRPLASSRSPVGTSGSVRTFTSCPTVRAEPTRGAAIAAFAGVSPTVRVEEGAPKRWMPTGNPTTARTMMAVVILKARVRTRVTNSRRRISPRTRRASRPPPGPGADPAAGVRHPGAAPCLQDHHSHHGPGRGRVAGRHPPLRRSLLDPDRGADASERCDGGASGRLGPDGGAGGEGADAARRTDRRAGTGERSLGRAARRCAGRAHGGGEQGARRQAAPGRDGPGAAAGAQRSDHPGRGRSGRRGQRRGSGEVRVRSLKPAPRYQGERIALGLLAGILVYLSLMIYGQTVAQGVVEEKTSRVVELLLATVRPWQLMLGKVVGIGSVGLGQLVVVAAAGLAAALGTGVLSIRRASPSGRSAGRWRGTCSASCSTPCWSRPPGRWCPWQEDVGAVTGPILMLIIVPYVVGVSVLPIDPENGLARVLSLIPFFSPMLMPMRTALGVAPWWEVALTVALTGALTGGLVGLSARVYRNSVMRTGARVPVRDALRAS